MFRESKQLARTPGPQDPNLANLHGANRPNAATGAFLGLTAIAGILELVVWTVVSVFYVPFYVLTRVLGRRPWRVVAHRVGTRKYREWAVRGWTASGLVIDEIVAQLEHQRSPRPHEAERAGVVLESVEWER